MYVSPETDTTSSAWCGASMSATTQPTANGGCIAGAGALSLSESSPSSAAAGASSSESESSVKSHHRRRRRRRRPRRAGGASPALDAARARLGGGASFAPPAAASASWEEEHRPARRRGASRSRPTVDGAPSSSPGDSVSASLRTRAAAWAGGDVAVRAVAVDFRPDGTATFTLAIGQRALPLIKIRIGSHSKCVVRSTGRAAVRGALLERYAVTFAYLRYAAGALRTALLQALKSHTRTFLKTGPVLNPKKTPQLPTRGHAHRLPSAPRRSGDLSASSRPRAHAATRPSARGATTTRRRQRNARVRVTTTRRRQRNARLPSRGSSP